MMDLEYPYTRVSLNNETYIFYILQSKFQRHDNKKIRLFVYHAFSLFGTRKWENTELSERRMSVKCLTRTDTNVYLWTPSRIQNTEKALIPWNISPRFTQDFNDCSKLRIPNFYRNLQFVLPCVQIMQIARIGVPWEAEVLWSEFHPCRDPLLAFPWYYLDTDQVTSDHSKVYKTSCPYIWKSTRNTWEARSSDLNFLPSLLAPHCHEENYVPMMRSVWNTITVWETSLVLYK